MNFLWIFLLSLIPTALWSQPNGGLPFIQNNGQWAEPMDFQAKVPGGLVAVSAQGFAVYLIDQGKMERDHLMQHQAINESDGMVAQEPTQGHYFQINFLGANLQAKAVPTNPLAGYYNYFLGRDTCRWAANVRAFSEIVYPEIYSGIDLKISSLGQNLKYDFVVKAGADPNQIQIEYCGVDAMELENGNVTIVTSVGDLREMKPYSFQYSEGKKNTIASEYRLKGNNISFSFPEGFDPCSELVIDPLLIFSTYSGSTADNWGSTATPGEHGTLYSSGVVNHHLAGAFPATVGAFQTTYAGGYDIAIMKYDSIGSQFLYATYLGGSGNDTPQSLVMDGSSGDLILLGISASLNFPVSPNAFDKTFNGGVAIQNRVTGSVDAWDIILTRIKSTGNQIIGSTYLGGSKNDGLNVPTTSGGPLVKNYGDEMRGDVITDNNGNVFISSVTSSFDFPATASFGNAYEGGGSDGLVLKMTPDLSSIVWSGFLGGAFFDAAYSIKFDSDKNIVLAGGTTSGDFPVTPGAYQTSLAGNVDGWIARIAADGSSILHATFTGTPQHDEAYFVELNANGEIFCYGQTTGPMPITEGVYHKAGTGQFLQKFTPDLSKLVFSTVFGSGSIPNISPTAFLVNDCDNIFMSGWGGFVNSETGYWNSSTTGMPVTSDAFQKTTLGSDFYFIVLNSNATQLLYATFLGGNQSKTHVDGGTSRFDKYGIVYHAVCAGCQFGNSLGQPTSDFPTTPGSWSRVNRSQNCNNAAFKFDLASLRARIQTNNVKLNKPNFDRVCFPDSIAFQNLSIGGESFVWDLGDGTIINKSKTDRTPLLHQYQKAGAYKVKLKAIDKNTCTAIDSVIKTVNYFKPDFAVGPDVNMCQGETHLLTASGGSIYTWASDDGTFTSTQASVLVQPKDSTVYYVSIMDSDGCSKKDTVNVNIAALYALIQTNSTNFSSPNKEFACFPESFRFQNKSIGGKSFVWDLGDGTIINQSNSDTTSFVHQYQQEGTYKVTLVAYNDITCIKEDKAERIVRNFMNRITVGPDSDLCFGSQLQLKASGGAIYHWKSKDGAFQSSEPSPVVSPEKSTTYFVNVIDKNGCSKMDTVHIKVIPKVEVDMDYEFSIDCINRTSISVRNLSVSKGDENYFFDFGDGSTSDAREIDHAYEKDGVYSLKIVGVRAQCRFEKSTTLPIYPLFVPNVFTPQSSPGYNDKFIIGFGADHTLSDFGLQGFITIVDRWGKPVFESSDYKNDWDASAVEGGIYYLELKLGNGRACKSWVHVVK